MLIEVPVWGHTATTPTLFFINLSPNYRYEKLSALYSQPFAVSLMQSK